jgi:hypothetical protein
VAARQWTILFSLKKIKYIRKNGLPYSDFGHGSVLGEPLGKAKDD